MSNTSSKSLEEYQKEYIMLEDLKKCSLRYLVGVRREFVSDEEYSRDYDYARELTKLCEKYQNRLNKKCIKNTGKSLK